MIELSNDVAKQRKLPIHSAPRCPCAADHSPCGVRAVSSFEASYQIVALGILQRDCRVLLPDLDRAGGSIRGHDGVGANPATTTDQVLQPVGETYGLIRAFRL